MLYLDVKYLKQVSYRLERFKIKKDDGNTFLANCRCPICGDSDTSKKKARGYFYSFKNSVMYKCHNCNASVSFKNWLKEFDNNVFKEYRLEGFKNKQPHEVNNVDLRTKPYRPSVLLGAKDVTALSETHPVRAYLTNRKIPESLWNLFYYVPRFFEWTKQHTDKFKGVDTSKDHPRLIIPWYTEDNECFAYQARAFGDEKPKYYSIVVDKKPAHFYGLERLDKDKKIYVVEGPIDSLFLSNAVAVGSSALHTYEEPGCEVVYVMDNENRNREILKEYKKLIDAGHNVCIMPDTYTHKDINEAILAGLSSFDIQKIIDDNTVNGLRAMVRFNEWRKLDVA